MIEIRPANEKDFDEIYKIFRKVIQRGDTFPYPIETSKEEAYEILMGMQVMPFIALDGVKVVGSYHIKANWPGRGAHIANGTYMVDPEYRGKGVGLLLGEHSLKTAKDKGFKAMQFNYVVSTNAAAVHLWKKIGMKIVGTVPRAFDHVSEGLVDTYVMHKSLE